MASPPRGSLLKNSLSAIFAEALRVVDRSDVALDTLKSQSNFKVTWKCSVCNHEWDTSPANRTRGRGCPECSKNNQRKHIRALAQAPLGKSLSDLYPEIALEFKESLVYPDMGPVDICARSNQLCIWKCIICGNEWEAKVDHRTRRGGRGKNCSNCNGTKKIAPFNKSLQTLYPQIAEQFIVNETTPDQTPDTLWPGSSNLCRWKCIYGHEWVASVGSRAINGNGCAQCSGQRQSRLEFELAELSRVATNEEVELDVIVQVADHNYRIDMVFSRIGLFIDLDPSYWHSQVKAVQRDQQKSQALTLINYVRVRAQSLPILIGKIVIVPDNCMDAYRWFQALRPIFLENNISWTELNSSSIATALATAALRWNESRHRLPKFSALEHSPNLKNEFLENLTRPGIGLELLTPTSKDQCRWQCPYCSNKWKANVADRTNGRGCPVCGRIKSSRSKATPKLGKSIQDLYLEISTEFISNIDHPERTPTNINPGSNDRCRWKCITCKHEWEASVYCRTKKGTGCPSCGRRQGWITRRKNQKNI